VESLEAGPARVPREEAPGPAFRMLGPLEISGPAGAVRMPPGRQEVILAALLLERNRVVSTSYLVDLIWDEIPPETARTQVQICVSRIRKEFATASVPASIVTRPQGYLLQVDDAETDIGVFDNQVAQAHALAREGRVAGAVDLLRTAAALWRGTCLGQIPSETLARKALRLDEERLAAVESRLELELALGRGHQLVGELVQLVEEHPLRGRLRGHLMLALYRSGRQAEALDVYRVGRAVHAELGLDPGDDLRTLEEAILANDPALRVNAVSARNPSVPVDEAPPAVPSDDGPQAPTGPDTGTAAPPSVVRAAVPRQLPAYPADFVGDEELFSSVEQSLVHSDGREAAGIAVLVGRPGIGKSTTATCLAHRMSTEHFPDGQLYCDLRGVRSHPVEPLEVLGRFLRALGMPGPSIPDSLDERAEIYRSLLATRQVLIFLDDAASESQITPLLPGSGSSVVIVTSRARLTGLPGAHRVQLDVLSRQRALDLLGRIIGVERAAAEPAAADALIGTVGRLPLALRIIGARLAARPHWSLATMVHRLANERRRLDELSHGEMTIRASLLLSYDGLAATDRRLLRLLSLAPGPTVPEWIAGALLDDDNPSPSDLLEPLVDMQLLDVAGAGVAGEFAYRFHEVTRYFAQEKRSAESQEQEQAQAVQRMVGGWMTLAEQAHRRIYGSDYTVLTGHGARWSPPEDHMRVLLADPLAWMDAEQVNLSAAVELAARAGLDELCWDLATTLVTLFEARGYLDHWESTHRVALDAVRLAGNERGTAAVLGSLGTLHLNRRQFDSARAALSTALGTFERIEDDKGQALCLRDLALIKRFEGDHDQALALYNRARDGFARSGDIVGRATVLTQSAHILIRRGQFAQARTLLGEALEVYRSTGYAGGQAHALRRLGQMHMQRGEAEAAVRILTDVLGMVRDSGDVIGEGHLLRDLGTVNARMSRWERSRDHLQQALAVHERIMDHGGAAILRVDMAKVLSRLGQGSQARALLAQAVSDFRNLRMESHLRVAQRLLQFVTSASAAAPPLPEGPRP
jgi:DNA-binding SARP family transcriptional activator/tetratricopeptide (TPR) repeat protein